MSSFLRACTLSPGRAFPCGRLRVGVPHSRARGCLSRVTFSRVPLLGPPISVVVPHLRARGSLSRVPLSRMRACADFISQVQRQASLEEEARWLRLVGRNFEAWGDVLLPAPLSASPSVLIETLVPGALRRGHTPSCSFYSVIVLSCARRAHRRIHQLRRCDRLGPRPDPRAREAASNLCLSLIHI